MKAVLKFLSSDDDTVVNSSLRTIAHLTENCSDDAAYQVIQSGSLAVLLEMCSCDKLQLRQHAVSVMLELTKHQSIRPVLGNVGIINFYINEIERCSTVAFINALCLCGKESVNRVRLRESGGLLLLLKLLGSDDCKEAHEIIINGFLSFLYDERSLMILLQNDLVNILIDKLRNYASLQVSVDEKPTQCNSASTSKDRVGAKTLTQDKNDKTTCTSKVENHVIFEKERIVQKLSTECEDTEVERKKELNVNASEFDYVKKVTMEVPKQISHEDEYNNQLVAKHMENCNDEKVKNSKALLGDETMYKSSICTKSSESEEKSNFDQILEVDRDERAPKFRIDSPTYRESCQNLKADQGVLSLNTCKDLDKQTKGSSLSNDHQMLKQYSPSKDQTGTYISWSPGTSSWCSPDWFPDNPGYRLKFSPAWSLSGSGYSARSPESPFSVYSPSRPLSPATSSQMSPPHSPSSAVSLQYSPTHSEISIESTPQYSPPISPIESPVYFPCSQGFNVPEDLPPQGEEGKSVEHDEDVQDINGHTATYKSKNLTSVFQPVFDQSAAEVDTQPLRVSKKQRLTDSNENGIKSDRATTDGKEVSPVNAEQSSANNLKIEFSSKRCKYSTVTCSLASEKLHQEEADNNNASQSASQLHAKEQKKIKTLNQGNQAFKRMPEEVPRTNVIKTESAHTCTNTSQLAEKTKQCDPIPTLTSKYQHHRGHHSQFCLKTINHILILLSRLSQGEDPSNYIVTSNCMETLLYYLSKYVNHRALRIVLRLVRNPLCLVRLIQVHFAHMAWNRNIVSCRTEEKDAFQQIRNELQVSSCMFS